MQGQEERVVTPKRMISGFLGVVSAYALLTLLGEGVLAAGFRTVLYLALPVIAIAGLVAVSRTTAGIERRSWRFLSATAILFGAADASWVIEHLLGASAWGGLLAVSDTFFMLSFAPLVLYVGTVLSSALQGAPVLTKTRYVLDLAIAMVLLGSVVFVLVLLPNYGGVSGSVARSQWYIWSVLNISGLFAFVALSANILESRERLWGRWEAKVVGAIGLMVASSLASSVLLFADRYAQGELLGLLADIGWMGGYFLLAVAAVERLGHQAEVFEMPVMAHARRGRVRWYDYAVASGLLLIVPYVLYQSRYAALSETEYWVLGAGASLLSLLVLVRSVVLTSENGSLLFLTVVDPLTGTYNHRFFQERMGVEVARARKSGDGLSLLLLDIDEFSKVNEQHGHSQGDQCLTQISQMLRRHEAPTDVLCRLGSDEFALIMPSTGVTAALSRAHEIQESLATDREMIKTVQSVSVGIAAYPDHADDRAELMAKADGALYWAQITGTGNIVVYDDEVVEALSPDERLHLAEEQSYMQTVESLAAAVDARDRYTQNHSQNVAEYASLLAMDLGLPPNQVRLIRIAGLLHDVGKIGVSDSILRKPGALTEEERAKIMEHPELGERILSATIFTEILPWVLSHHERWDGAGYPHGIAGEEIPLEARILAVCDAYDAMVSDRPYRQGMDHAAAIREIRRSAGTQFDPYIAKTFVALCDAGGVPMRDARDRLSLDAAAPA